MNALEVAFCVEDTVVSKILGNAFRIDGAQFGQSSRKRLGFGGEIRRALVFVAVDAQQTVAAREEMGLLPGGIEQQSAEDTIEGFDKARVRALTKGAGRQPGRARTRRPVAE